ncbi:MAG TPA: PTS sugar transporter subunit IIA [Desulfonatronum sp.]|nr:PTS sugar transporter subunit IIA [Desulfonatronum sp.]
MIGVVLVTHTEYGLYLLKAAELILGPQENCFFVSVDVTKEVDKSLAEIKSSVKQSDQGEGVVLLTDMFGGTPTNLSLSLLNLGKHQLEVITGVNLPMLLRVLGSRGLLLSDLAREAKAAGTQGIVVAGEVLRSKVAKG